MAHRVRMAATVLALLAMPVATAALTPTPTSAPTPQRTGDLGTKTVTGRVYDAIQGPSAGIANARVDYARSARFPPGESGSAVTDATGEFTFQLFLHDTDDVYLSATAPGYVTVDLHYSGYGLWNAPPLAIALTPARGSIAIAPSAVSLPCEGDGEVTIRNPEPTGGEPLTIFAIVPSNSYSQGDYGTGFTWDLSAITLPLTLAPGEQVAFPVHYSAAGQSYPSRLTVRVRSTAGDDAGFSVPYRGAIAGCTTPTPTATPPPTVACAGDCDGDGTVTIAELVRGVALALGHPVAACANADLDANGSVVVNELITAVAAASEGCPPTP